MKYLITGGHGKLGKELCPLIDCVSPTHEEMDILNVDQIEKFVSQKEIEGVIHMVAISDRKIANSNKPLSYSINVIGTRNIASICKKNNKPIIYISTDCVFSGKDGNEKEDSPTDPSDWYGMTKYAGELEIQNATDDYLIIRTSFRPKLWPFPTAFENIITTADYVDVIAKEISKAIELNLKGILHIGTPKKSMFELAIERTPNVKAEKADESSTRTRNDLNIDKWLSIKNQ